MKYDRKRFAFICFVALSCCISLSAQSVQQGNTMEYKGAKEKTALSGVNIVAGGATAKSGKGASSGWSSTH